MTKKRMNIIRMSRYVITYLATMVTVLDISSGQSLNHTRNLFVELFTTRNYNKFVRPVENQSDCLEIHAQFGLLSVTKLDVRDGRLIASGASSWSWIDPQLSWNASNYGNLTMLPIPASFIWRPDLVQYSSDIVTTDGTVSVVWLYNTGQVRWMTAANHATTCETNIFAFPFDTHDCTFYFMTSTHTVNEILLVPNTHYVELYNTWTNQEWKYSDHGCYTDIVFGPVGFSRLRCNIHLQRRPQFVIYHLLMPLFCLILVTIFVFWVPITSGERLGFSVTLFLAYNVQLAALLEELPRNSITTPFYSRALVGMNIISALCVVFSVIVNRISLKSDAEVPESLKFIVRRCARKTKKKKCCTAKVTPVKCIINPGRERKESGGINDIADSGDDCLKMFGYDEDEVTWLEVAEAVDYILFVLILLAVGTGVAAALVIVFSYEE